MQMIANGFVGGYFLVASSGFLLVPGIGTGAAVLSGMLSLGFLAIDFYLEYQLDKLDCNQKLGWQP